MSRLKRFEAHRYVGIRDTMKVYDCDDEEQFVVLSNRVESDGLLERDLIQSFGPDLMSEAVNRGFTAVRDRSVR